MRHISWIDRLEIEKLYNSGASYRVIARKVGFAVSSVYAEVQRGLYDHKNTDWTVSRRYSAQIAEDAAIWAASSKGCPVKLGCNYDYAQTVATRISAGESPDAIVGSLRKSGSWTVSTTTLYRYIDRGYIPGVTNKKLLVKPRRKRSYNAVKKAARPPKGISIEKRPEYINARIAPGHWEMDSVIGKKEGKGESIVVLTERYTRYELICKVPDKSSVSVVRALNRVVRQYPAGTFQSITVDNGTEFSDNAGMSAFAPIYYCHPFSSCERGSNENANGIIRRYFPKGQSLCRRTQKDCDAVAYKINHMHRKILGYATAAELFEKWQATLV